MSLQLPFPPTPATWSVWKSKLELADSQNIKSGQDVIIGSLPGSTRQNRLILTDENGGKWQITVDHTGALKTESVQL
ncbi:hypothetical protein [Paraburkholderia terrae]|uniref:hypothetical protein n=1 Tax=Paraburkholderia terrae TaxID=311230 RepID=UPI0020BE2990|nr:hypothetical protein [Paraburkholderia terrae]